VVTVCVLQYVPSGAWKQVGHALGPRASPPGPGDGFNQSARPHADIHRPRPAGSGTNPDINSALTVGRIRPWEGSESVCQWLAATPSATVDHLVDDAQHQIAGAAGHRRCGWPWLPRRTTPTPTHLAAQSVGCRTRVKHRRPGWCQCAARSVEPPRQRLARRYLQYLQRWT
jgi:hypothetical protein